MSCAQLRVFAITGSLLVMDFAYAEMPVAIVEETTGKPAGVEFMDYVAAGKVIELGPRPPIFCCP
jgi:hypothetical protein